MPITISGNGGISGLGNIDGHDLETATLVVSGDTTLGPQAVGRSTLFVDESANVVGINTTTPAAAVFLEVADATDPIVSLNNEGNGEVRIGCTDAQGYLRTNSSHPLVLQTNATDALVIDVSQNIGAGTTTPNARIESQGDNSSTTQFNGFQGLRIHNTNGSAFGVTADINLSAGTTTNNRGAAIGVEYDSGTSGNSLYFATNPNAVTSNDTLVERLRIDPAGNVGINKSASLGAKLHIQDDSATETTLVKLRNYKASVNTKTGLMFECSTASSQGGNSLIRGVCGTDAGGSNSQNDGGLEFQTSSGGAGTLATRLLLTSTGNAEFSGSATIGGTLDVSHSLYLNDSTVDLYSQTTNVNSKTFQLFSDVGATKDEKFVITAKGDVVIGPYNTLPYLKGMRLFPDNSGRPTIVLNGDGSNNTAFGVYNGNTSSYPLKLKHDGSAEFHGGIRLGTNATTAATLNDYEEGTFIPNWDSTGATFTYDASYHQGVYTKIGNTCYFHFYMGITAPPGGTTSNDLYISGLPETIANIPNAIPSFSLGSNINIAVPGGLVANVLSMRITGLQNQTRIQLSWNLENGGQVSLKASDLTTSSYISISGFYQCA